MRYAPCPCSERIASRGVTVVELLVVLAILGIIASAIAVAAWSPVSAGIADTASALAEARQSAVSQGRQITIEITVDGVLLAVTANPDGSLVSDDSSLAERFAGVPRHATP